MLKLHTHPLFLFCLILLMALSLTSTSFAHSKIQESIPNNNAVLKLAPENITLAFGSKIKLTKVTLQVNSQEPIDLDISQLSSFDTEFLITNPERQQGEYLIHWRGLGIDGHVMKGELSFSIE